MASLNDQTPGGVLAYCEYLTEKGYATAAQVNPWRTAVQQVFETVEGEAWEMLDLSSIDLDEYLGRFRTLTGAQYKAETITTYGRRIQNALEAQNHFIATGRPPSFRQRGTKAKSDDRDAAGTSVVEMNRKSGSAAQSSIVLPPPGMTDFPYPLGNGQMVTLRLPSRLKSDDVTRICAFIRTLQDDSAEPRQLPQSTDADQESQAA